MSSGCHNSRDPCQVFPHELWARILREIRSSTLSRNCPLLPLIYVCKAWKEQALSLLYEHILIRSESQFDSFISHITSKSLIYAERGAWVRLLKIKATTRLSVQRVGLTVACLHTLKGLQSYDNISPISLAEISTLSYVVGDQLQRLSISISAMPTHIPEKSLDVLEQFSNLKVLCITLNGEFLPYEISGIQVPSVQKLMWTINHAQNISQIAYFSRCKFKSLVELIIKCYGIGPSSVGRFQSFFDEHKSIRELSLTLPPQCFRPFLSLNIRVKFTTLYMVITEFSVGHICAISNLPSHVRCLRVFMDKERFSENQRFLQHIHKSLQSHVRELDICTTCRDGFRWNSTDDLPESIMFIGLMHTYAKRLQQKKIDVIDKEGKSLKDD